MSLPTVAAVVIKEGAGSIGRGKDHEGAHEGQRQLQHSYLHHLVAGVLHSILS